MNETIKEFLVGLGFNVNEAQLKNFVDGVSTASLRAAALGAAVTAAAGVVVAGISEVANEAVKLDLLAQRLNTTASALDDFADTAEMVGIGGEEATASLMALNKVVGEAALGVGRGKIILEKLGIAAKDSNGHVRATTDVMADLQKKLSTMDRGQAMTIMDKLGIDPKMLRMFNGELGDTAKIGQELNNIDLSVGFNLDETIAQSNQYVKTQREMLLQSRLLKMWFSKLWEKLATDMMPRVMKVMDRVSKTIEELRMKLQSNGKQIVAGLEPFLDLILRIGESFMTFVSRTIGVAFNLVSAVVGVFNRMNEASGGWVGYLAIALAAWKAFNLGFLLTPIGAIVGIGVAILALYDDFMTWKEGGDSFFDWSAWADGAEQLISAVTGIIDVFDGIAVAIGGAVSIISGLLSLDFNKMIEGFTNLGTGAVMALQSIGESVINLISGITSLIASIFELFGFDVSGFANIFKVAFDSIVSVVDNVRKAISSVIDTIASAGGMFDGVFGDSNLTPSPVQRASVSNAQSVSQTTNINVSGGANPQATASAVASAQNGVNKNMARNVKGAVR